MAKKLEVKSLLKGDALDYYTADNEIGSIEEIDISLLKPFHNHPFKLYTGERLEDMIESIRTNGIITPVIVRKLKRDYEILSGHNRTNAAKLAGLTKVPCIVKDNISEEEAYRYVIETNLMQRSFSDFSISEKALILKTSYDNIKSQGKRNDIMSELNMIKSGEEGSNNRKNIADEYGLSSTTVARILRVNYLIPQFKSDVDEGLLPLLAAVNLSYLSEEAQNTVCIIRDEFTVKISEVTAKKIRSAYEDGESSYTDIKKIMVREKNTDKVQKVSVPDELYKKYFDGMKKKEVDTIIKKALEEYFAKKC